MIQSSTDVTRLLVAWSNGDKAAFDQLVPLVYDELRRLAISHLRRQRSDHTLQPTALVHEAYCRLVAEDGIRWQSRVHFLGMATRMMRCILVDHARRRHAAKRGGHALRLSLEAADLSLPAREVNLIALDDALKDLAAIDPKQSQIVELRFFGGLGIEETAELLGISPATVKREWRTARAWLYHEINNR
jgi:RNA polymerase sigma factor (TIGR02999 family)